jgi:glycosyltransferase involved in cell wall biosynthesis
MANISVIIPVYNKEDTIVRAVESVLTQSLQPLEIIVVNDGSTDDSKNKISSIRDERIKIINQKNKGVSCARNAGIDNANGNYVAFLDADDEWLPDYLSTISSLINLFPNAIVFATGYYKKYADEVVKANKLKRVNFNSASGILTNYFEICNNSDPPLWTSAVTVVKEEIRKINGFPEGIKAGEDLLTWARLSLKGEIAYSTNPCAIYYQPKYDPLLNPPDMNDFVGKELLKLSELILVESEERNLLRYLGNWHKMRAALYLITNHSKYALIEIRKSIGYQGLTIKIIFYILLILFPSNIRYKMLFERDSFLKKMIS